MALLSVGKKLKQLIALADDKVTLVKLIELFILRYNYPGLSYLKPKISILKHDLIELNLCVRTRKLKVFIRPKDTGDVASFFENFLELKPEDVHLSNTHNLIDCGAHIGFFSLLTIALSPNCQVVAYEPVPENFSLLEKNLRANSSNVTVLANAVWVKNGELAFQTGISNSGALGDEGSNSSITVKTISLKEYLLSINLLSIDYLKIDIEGAEVQVLPEILSLPFSDKINIYIEIHEVSKILGILKPEWEKYNWKSRLISSFSDNECWILHR